MTSELLDAGGTGLRRASIDRHQRISVILGSLWLLDGLLQLQPAQLRSGPASNIIMNAMGEPTSVGRVQVAVGVLLGHHPLVSTIATGAIQLIIGALIIQRRTTRLGLILSIPWSIGIWIFAEGFGMVISGYAELPAGSPGAALLYAVIALELLTATRSNARPLRLRLRYVWTTLWISAAALQLISKVPLAVMLRASFTSTANGEPSIFRSIDLKEAKASAGHPLVFALTLITIEIVIAYAPWMRYHRLTLPCVLAFLGIVWIAGENLGGLATGTASDPGLMPVLALIAHHCFVSRDDAIPRGDRARPERLSRSKLQTSAAPLAM